MAESGPATAGVAARTGRDKRKDRARKARTAEISLGFAQRYGEAAWQTTEPFSL
jgi:hypothetical protein